MGVRLSLSQIKQLNSKYNVFTSLRVSERPETAAYLPLADTSYAIKDNFTTRKEPTTCGSKMLENYISPFESTVSSLLDGLGSHCVGKTNMDEFGMGNSTTKSIFGPTLNPVFPQENHLVESYETETFYTKDLYDEKNGQVVTSEFGNGSAGTKHCYLKPKLFADFETRISSSQRVVGGSSGGSAAAVALDMVDFSIGSDTGGSVRLPASYTNIYGFKPTYGRISRWGLIAYAQSLDTVGIMSKDIDTIWKVFNTLDLHDSKDPSSLSEASRNEMALERLESKKNVGKKFRVGVPEEYLLEELSEPVKKSWKKLLNTLRESKLCEVFPVSIPAVKYCLPSYYTLCTAEAASNLSRYDGIRYGYRAEVSDVDGPVTEPEFVTTRSRGFGTEVQNRIILGNYALSSYGYDSHFKKATNVRSVLIDQFNKVFRDKHVLNEQKYFKNANGVDMLIVPTSAGGLPPPLSTFGQMDTVESYMNDVCTVPMSLAGLPTMNIPSDTSCLGFQLVGQHGQDYKVLEFCRLVQEVLSSTK